MAANRLSPDQQQVLRLVKCCGVAVEGISLRDLMRRLSGMSYADMLDAVEFLSMERLIFPTVDQYHYKWTDTINDYIMSPDAINVLRVIQSCRAVEGISLQGLEERLGGMDLPVIWEAVEFLSNEGYIYSTIDQYHYTSTDTINKVLGLIMYFQDSEGICLLDLKRYSRMSLPVIRQAVESLVDDGLVFSPIDGYHYKVTKAINKVLSMIKSCQDMEGVSLQELKKGLNGMSMPAIWQTVVFLTEARLIFATIDMEHYRSIDTTNEMLTPASSNCNARRTAMREALCNQQIECSF